MKLSTKLLTLALVSVPVIPAVAYAQTVAAAPTTVARYTFDKGTVSGRIAENSGRGVALKVRTIDGGTVKFPAAPGGGRYVGFPAHCVPSATKPCPRALLEGTDDSDLDPGKRQFRYGASVYVQKWQVHGSANIMQKGVVNTESQWKLQIGEKTGRAQCVVVGRGSAQTYVTRSDITVADGKWHRVMCLRTATALTVFVDGRKRGQSTLPAAVDISNSLPLRVGGPNFAASSDMYNGFLDDVYVALG